MTRKDFDTLVMFAKRLPSQNAISRPQIIEILVHILEERHPNFNRERFLGSIDRHMRRRVNS